MCFWVCLLIASDQAPPRGLAFWHPITYLPIMAFGSSPKSSFKASLLMSSCNAPRPTPGQGMNEPGQTWLTWVTFLERSKPGAFCALSLAVLVQEAWRKTLGLVWDFVRGEGDCLICCFFLRYSGCLGKLRFNSSIYFWRSLDILLRGGEGRVEESLPALLITPPFK